MVWMDIWILCHTVTTRSDVQDFRMQQLKSWDDASHLNISLTCEQAANPHGMVPTSISNITMVSDNIHIMWMGRKIHHYAATTAAVGTDRGSWLKFQVAAGHHTMPLCSSWGCRLTWRMVPKSTYNIYKVFDNIHMVWIDWWIHRHAVTTTHDDQDLRMQLKSWVVFGHQTIPLSYDWGCRPVLHGSHIHIKHKQGVWQPWYDEDGQNNPSPCRYHCSCWYRLGKLVEILSHCWASYHAIVQWLRV